MSEDVANKMKEVILVGLPGPSHHYGGLSADNKASSRNRGALAYPKEAALQTLELVRMLQAMGITVVLLPPHLRPYMPEIKHYFSGDEASIIEQAKEQNPALLEAMTASASMWAANTATVTPAIDNQDNRLHITIANLHTNLHRRIEAMQSYLTLRQIFARVPGTVIDMPLDAAQGFRDEGAANHMRLCTHHSGLGLHVFVYGADGSERDPKTARQTMSASQEIIKRHQLTIDAQILIKQNPQAIRQGVFHNDVIAMSNENLLIVHNEAFAMGEADINFIADCYAERTGQALTTRIVGSKELSVDEAVATYFFNSQLVTTGEHSMTLIAPLEVKEGADGRTAKIVDEMIADELNPITEVKYINLRQSMKNGGGPACLRLRVPMSEAQSKALAEHSGAVMNDERLERIESIIHSHYPDQLYADEINYALYQQSKNVLQALGNVMGLRLLDEGRV